MEVESFIEVVVLSCGDGDVEWVSEAIDDMGARRTAASRKPMRSGS